MSGIDIVTVVRLPVSGIDIVTVVRLPVSGIVHCTGLIAGDRSLAVLSSN